MEEKSIWPVVPSLDVLNNMARGTLLDHLGIVFTAIGSDYIEATLPVDHRTIQPMGLLHGGATAALAETLGSMAAQMMLTEGGMKQAVGIELNINHLKSMREGKVTGRVTPVRVGRKIQVWETKIRNDEGALVSVSRLTVMIVEM